MADHERNNDDGPSHKKLKRGRGRSRSRSRTQQQQQPQPQQTTTISPPKNTTTTTELLVEWLVQNGAKGLENLQVKSSGLAGGGMGVFTTAATTSTTATSSASSKQPLLLTPGSLVARIPRVCVLTAAKALASDMGRACRAIHPECSDEFVLILWMAAGRLDTTHLFHKYLASLPKETTTPMGWPSSSDSDDGMLLKGGCSSSSSSQLQLQLQLDGTNLASAIVDHRALVHVAYKELLDAIWKAPRPAGSLPVLPVGCDIETVAWAHDMYISRRFPESLGAVHGGTGTTTSTSGSISAGNRPTTSTLTHGIGCMLPFLDLLNHKSGTKMKWVSDGLGVAFHVGGAGTRSGVMGPSPTNTPSPSPTRIRAGVELFNNYGKSKSNEELLLAHGFCIKHNVHDSYGLKLTMRTSTANPRRSNNNSPNSNNGGGATHLGKFFLLRADNPDVLCGTVEQIPSLLWRAISDPAKYLKTEEGKEHDGDGDGAEDEDHDHDHQVYIDTDDVEVLLSLVQSRIAPFLKTKREDIKLANYNDGDGDGDGDGGNDDQDMRAVFVAMYRDGQRRVLEDAMGALVAMLGGTEEEEEDESLGF